MVTNIDVTTNTPSLLIGDSSKIENFGFRLSFDNEKVAYHFIDDFAVNATYALSCGDDYLNKDSVTSIEIKTQNSFDNTHPAGSSIAEYLLARPGSMSFNPGTFQYKSIDESIYYVNPENIINNNILDFRFKNISPFLGQHKFVVTVSFKSGRTLSDSTSIRLY